MEDFWRCSILAQSVIFFWIVFWLLVCRRRNLKPQWLNRTQPNPSSASPCRGRNSSGDIFGGWLMVMDMARLIAGRHSHAAVTVAMTDAVSPGQGRRRSLGLWRAGQDPAYPMGSTSRPSAAPPRRERIKVTEAVSLRPVDTRGARMLTRGQAGIIRQVSTHNFIVLVPARRLCPAIRCRAAGLRPPSSSGAAGRHLPQWAASRPSAAASARCSPDEARPRLRAPRQRHRHLDAIQALARVAASSQA